MHFKKPNIHLNGIWYVENEDNFLQFLDLKQEELSVLEYSNEFSRLQDACGMEDDEEHDFISFVRGLRPDIVERMTDCKTIHEAFWEAIRVERMLKRSHIVEVTPLAEKSSHVIDYVEEPMPADILTDQPELNTEDSISTIGLENSPMSANNPQVQTPSDEEQVVDTPYISSQIDFVFMDHHWQSGDQEWLLKDCNLMVQIPHVTSPMDHVYLQAHFNHQIKGCAKFSILKIYVQAQDQSTNRKFV